MLFYNGTEADGRAAYKTFFDIGLSRSSVIYMRYTYSPLSGPVVDMTREIPFEMINTLQVQSLLPYS